MIYHIVSYHIIPHGYELSWVRVVLGRSCPGYELSWVRVVLGTNCLGYELSWVRVVLGTSCLGYDLSRSPPGATPHKTSVRLKAGPLESYSGNCVPIKKPASKQLHSRIEITI